MKPLFVLLLFVFVDAQIMTGKLLGEPCHIAHDCMSFCCNNTDKRKEGKCVKKLEFAECKDRKKISYIILSVIITLIFLITIGCVMRKLDRDKKDVLNLELIAAKADKTNL